MEPADLAQEMQTRKKEKLASVKFIGHLFLRQLLGVNVIGHVVLVNLIAIGEALPEEHMIECTCELLHTIGYTADLTETGKNMMSMIIARLVDLKRLKTSDDMAFAFSSLGIQIQNLIDLRGNGWQRKSFRQTVQIKEEGAGTYVMFATQVVGQRPAYIENKLVPAGYTQNKPARPRPARPRRPALRRHHLQGQAVHSLETEGPLAG